MGNHLCVYVRSKRKLNITNPTPLTLHLETILENYVPPNHHDIKRCTQVYTCEICCEQRPTQDTFTPYGCDHFYCTKCTLKYIVSKLQINVLDLNCPKEGCHGKLSPQFCMPILPHEVLVWWERALCESVIPEKEKFYCPFNNCSALFLYSEPHKGGGGISNCPHCKRSICTKCRVPWHSGMTCQKYQKLKNKSDALMIDLVRRMKWRRCPNCMHYVEKKNGCDDITCRLVSTSYLIQCY